MALKIYKVSLKQGNKYVFIKATNADNAIAIAKRSSFSAFANLNKHQFKADLVQPGYIAKIEKTNTPGLYNVYNQRSSFSGDVYFAENVSLNKAKKIQKVKYLEYIKRHRTGESTDSLRT